MQEEVMMEVNVVIFLSCLVDYLSSFHGNNKEVPE